jgi:hypothetical protein
VFSVLYISIYFTKKNEKIYIDIYIYIFLFCSCYFLAFKLNFT